LINVICDPTPIYLLFYSPFSLISYHNPAGPKTPLNRQIIHKMSGNPHAMTSIKRHGTLREKEEEEKDGGERGYETPENYQSLCP
jgi:hypothetical protein